MSDPATATLSASDLAPVGSLTKSFNDIRGKMVGVEKQEDAATAAENKALGEEKTEIERQREETKTFAKENPFPKPNVKPFTEKEPENNPIQRFGSWASALGILAGAITKTGLESSLNASASAMNAIRKNDLDSFDRAHAAWKENTEVAYKNAEWEAKGYQNAFDLMQTDHAAGLSAMKLTAEQAGNTAALAKLKEGNLKDLWSMAQTMSEFALRAPAQMDQLNALADQNRRIIQLNDQWKKEHPGQDIPPDVALANRTKSIQEAQARQNWQVLVDPKTGTTYRYNAQTAEATTLDGKPYTPQGAGKVGTDQTGGANPMDPETVDYWATRVRSGEAMPPLGVGTQAANMRRQIATRAAQLAKESGSSPEMDMVKRATLNAERASLTKLVPQKNAIHQFEETALANGRVLLDLVDKVDSTGVPVIERWIRGGRKSIAGDPDVTNFNTQLGVFVPEVAKILTNPNLSGVLSDTARAEAENLIPQNVTAEQLHGIIPLLEADFGRRSKALDDEIGIVQDTIRDLGSTGQPKKGADKGGAKPPAGMPDDARKADDGHWYAPDTDRPGKYLDYGEGK